MSRAYLCSLAGFQVTTIGRFWVTAEGEKTREFFAQLFDWEISGRDAGMKRWIAFGLGPPDWNRKSLVGLRKQASER